jgi:hypothetical protein
MGPRVFSILLAMLAVVGVFNYIPFVSRYAFWVLLAAYIISLAGISRSPNLSSMLLLLRSQQRNNNGSPLIFIWPFDSDTGSRTIIRSTLADCASCWLPCGTGVIAYRLEGPHQRAP